MSINIRVKGADGEREVATDLNTLIYMVRTRLGLPPVVKPEVQRNQNQTAVGGKDLIGTYGLAIEVKRQEALSINTWWRQCEVSADNLGEIPVLIFRQNKQKWRVITYAQIPLESSYIRVRMEMTYDDFKIWFAKLVEEQLMKSQPKKEDGLFPLA